MLYLHGQRDYLCTFQFQELKRVEYNEVDADGLIISVASSIESGALAIESEESCLIEE